MLRINFAVSASVSNIANHLPWFDSRLDFSEPNYYLLRIHR